MGTSFSAQAHLDDGSSDDGPRLNIKHGACQPYFVSIPLPVVSYPIYISYFIFLQLDRLRIVYPRTDLD
jgi:hypothetical protein